MTNLMPRTNASRIQHLHYGITLMEVIFAIGVLLTGLVGLASLIPIAAGNAKATLEMDRSVSESTSMAAAGITRNFNRLDSIVIYDKPAAGSPGTGVSQPYGYVPESRGATISYKIGEQGFPLAAPVIFPGKLESPGYGHHTFGSGLTSGICIDPLGMPSVAMWQAEPGNTATGGNALTGQTPGVPAAATAYEFSRFPYYSERYNVLAAPNEDILPATGPAAWPQAPPWPMGPRMWRATLVSELQNDGIAPVTPRETIAPAAINRIFQGFGDLSTVDGLETSDPTSVLLDRTRIGGNLYDAGRDISSKYSWFATLAPPLLGGNSFRQSVVVVQQRSSPIPQRLGDPLSLNQAPYTVTDAEENPNSERLAWVGQAVGFDGGSGGEVVLYGSSFVGADINLGEWVMLSRQPFDLTVTPALPIGPAVHRWFRVVRVGEPTYGLINTDLAEANWPTAAGDPRVWRRAVTLAGPDWSFGIGSPNIELRDDTFCTIVIGAVSVSESEVTLLP